MSCLSTINSLLNVVRIILDTVDVSESTCQVLENGSLTEKSALAVRVGVLACNTLEALGVTMGASADRLKKIKLVEAGVRAVQVPVEIARAEERQEPILRKICVAHGVAVSFVRSLSQAGVYQEKAYLELPKEEFDQTLRPIVEYDIDGSPTIVGCKFLCAKECQENIASGMKLSAVLGTAELALRSVGTAKGAADTVTILYRYLLERARQQVIAGSGAQIDPFNLLRLPRIPEPLHEDQVFARYTCSITHEPIRDPVADPTTNNRTLYERDAILEWLASNDTSPTSRQYLDESMLRPRRAVKALIEGRLVFYEEQLRAHALTLHQQPIDLALDAAAQAEYPLQ